MKKHALILKILFFLTIFPNINGQEKDTIDYMNIPLEELIKQQISISSSQAKTVFNTPSTVSVIDASMIKSYNFLSAAEAINTIAGMSSYKTTSRTDIPTSRGVLQGHYNNKVLVMVNGVANWNATLGASSLERIGIQDVERIEILKGPASVLYGTNAYSGAINIILKSKKENDYSRSETTLGAGNKETFTASGNATVAVGEAQISVFANSMKQNGEFRNITDGAGIKGQYRDFQDWQNASMYAKYKSHSILLNGFTTTQSKLGVDPLFSAGLGMPHTLNGYLVNYTFEKEIIKDVNLKFGGTLDLDDRLFPRESASDLSTSIKSKRLGGFLQVGWKINSHINWEVGGDLDNRTSIEYRNYYISKDSTLTESNLKDKSIREYSAFSQIGIDYKPLSLVAGVRATKNEYFSTNISPRVTIVYAINEKNSLKLIYGESFRAPSLFEVYFLNPKKSLTGNKNLKPETSKSIEATYLTSFRNIFVQTTVYQASYENKIIRYKSVDPVILSDGTTKANVTTHINGSTFKATGVELEAKYMTKQFNAFLNYNYIMGNKGDQTSTDPTSDNYYNYNFRAVPNHTVKAGTSVPIKRAYISLLGYWYSSMEAQLSPASPLYVKINPQYKLDLSMGYNMYLADLQLRHQISIKNLTNNETFLPETVDRALPEIPWNMSRLILYTITVNF